VGGLLVAALVLGVLASEDPTVAKASARDHQAVLDAVHLVL
jgi:hypothetical protein